MIASRLSVVLLATFAASPSVNAQPYPSRPVQVVVGTPAGGPSDLTARAIATAIRSKFGHAFVIENRPGASGKIGAEYVARSTPDGHTLLFANPSTFSLPVLTDKIPPYDPIADFAPIGYVAVSANALLVPSNAPYKTLRDLLSSEKAKKGQLNFGNGGTGSAAHFAAAMLALAAGIEVTHVPYRGEAPLLTDLLAGQVDVGFATGARPYIEAGQLRALAVTSGERFARMPDVPSIAEQGFPGFNFIGWLGMLAPVNTPPAVISALNEMMQFAATDEGVQKVVLTNGIAPVPPTKQDRLAALIERDISALRKLIAEGKIKVSP